MMELNKNSSVPLYQQIQNIILSKIENGEIGLEEQIPSEEKLSEQYDVSRMTVRKALSRLEYEGVLYRIPGKGTFVQKRFNQELSVSLIIGFKRKMELLGREVVTKIVSVNIVKPSLYLKNSLNLNLGEKIYEIKRLRYIEDEPLVLQTGYMPCKLFPNLAKFNMEGSLTDIIEKNYGIKINNYQARIRPAFSDQTIREFLKISEHIPLLKVDGISYSNHKAIRLTNSIYRGDRFDFVVNNYQYEEKLI